MKAFTLAALAALFLLSACGAQAPTTGGSGGAPATGGIEISGAWVRPSPQMDMSQPTPTMAMGGDHGGMDMGGVNSAAYMVIRNGSAQEDKLLSAAGDVAKTIELHTVENKDGVMQMRPVEGGIPVPANGQAELKPGGYHVMLIGLTRELKPGDTVKLTLTFEKAGTREVTAEVREP
jgi:copper(I)-binding protein